MQRDDRIEPFDIIAVQKLRDEAEGQMFRAPREGLALAQRAFAAARSLADAVLQAECALTLAEIFDFLGEFTEAVPLCTDAAATLTTHGRFSEAARSYRVAARACNELKQPERALAYLSQARLSRGAEERRSRGATLPRTSAPLLLCSAEVAHEDFLEASIRRSQGRYAEALALLTKAREAFTAAGLPLEVARCDMERSRALFLSDPDQALALLDRARAVFDEHQHTPEAALCDYYKALALQEANRYPEALAILQQTRITFAQHSMNFYVALADAMSCVNQWRMNRFEEALVAGERAYAYFSDKRLAAWTAMSQVNLAIVYYSLNRYEEALALYTQAADLCLRENLPIEAARCHENMALAYEKLGRYNQALALHQRAHQAFHDQGLDTYTAICDENMASTYRWLGRYDEALRHFAQAREAFVQRDLPIYVARCDTAMADVYLTMGRLQEALNHLEQARATCESQGMAVYVAACDRGIAQAQAKSGRRDEALALLERARAAFAQAGLAVDAALCDLAAGEVHLTLGACTLLHKSEWEAAEARFTAALQVLNPGIPDQAWRAQYGQGRCAVARGERSTALSHYLSAVQTIRRARAALPTELLSGSFFTDRSQVYEEALPLALQVGTTEQALDIVEASKAQSFLTLIGRLGDSWRRPAPDDPYLAKWLDQEATLRREIEELRRKLTFQREDQARPILRQEEDLRSGQPEFLARLVALSQAYEEIVERLRIAAPRLMEAQRPPPFSVEGLRQAAMAHLPAHWACLEYYLQRDTLVIFYLDPHRLSSHVRQLNAYDRMALRQCTALEPDFRELVYRGTIRGYPAPHAPGRTYLRHLYDLLIPPEVRGLREEDLLIIAPHNSLHWLSFQALLADDVPLMVRVPLVYVPSLGALQLLMGQGVRIGPVERVLACGLSDFGPRARALPSIALEVTAMQESLGERLHVLWDSQANREALQRLSQDGELAQYDVIHLATHAVLDGLAPSQTRLLLADGDLTIVDILGLKLDSQVVVLSACEGATGHMSPGDEMMGLARAFFLAGARGVVASLWPVEDVATGEIMRRFYRRLCAGEGIACALRGAQLEMARAGCPAYQWASFIAIGRP